MSIIPGMKLHGFTVTRVRPVAEQHGSLVEMTHDKTGAALVWLDNGEENKLFSIAFKTLPEDSTGVFHILEHSVLCGSEKYPVREPFVELIKGSMNTFLNAMTFPDKTMYPVSSRNEQDFMNLTEVYLDAVLAPAILKNPNIFYQEGWHIETDENGVPSYKGVVFNEMKGAMSDAKELVIQKNLELLYPDNCYQYNSGGEPRVIPQLTYEQFLAMYRKYYHPSNARIYLDGAVPLDRVLTLIASYLDRFERSDAVHAIPLQTPRACEATQVYALSAEEDATDRNYLSLSKIVGSWADKTNIMAAEVLMDMLMGSNEAPLKKALLDSGLCQETEFMLDSANAQPALGLIFTNVKDGKAEELRNVVRATCRELREKGLNKAALTASINEHEFHVRTAQEPAGLMRNINCLNTWLYGGDPITYLENDADFAKMREMAENGGFDALMEKLLLDESDMVVLHTLPSKTYEAELKADEEARLQAITSAWTEADRAANAALNAGLSAWQQTPDTAEQLATLPMLDVKDIPETCALISTQEKAIDGATVLNYDLHNGGVTRMTLYISLTDYTLDELSVMGFVCKCLGELPTANYDAGALSLAKKTYLGELSFRITAAERKVDTCVPHLVVDCAVLDANVEKARELLHEILTTTDFSDKVRVGNLLTQEIEQMRYLRVADGVELALCTSAAGCTAAGAVAEAVRGVTYEATLKRLSEDSAELQALAARLQKEGVCRSRMVLSIASDRAAEVEAMLADYPLGVAAPADAAYQTALPKNTCVTIPAQIGYAVMATDLRLLGQVYAGTGKVVANVLSYSYLWNAVRVQGGAYGCYMGIQPQGRVLAYSYRDPTPARTLGVYRRMADALREFVDGEEKVEKYIISTVAENEVPLGARAQMKRAEALWWVGVTEADQRRERLEILRTDDAALLGWCIALEKMAREAAICVVAHEGALKDCEQEHLEKI